MRYLIILSLVLSLMCLAETTATRDLPVTYVPGGLITVRIDINVDQGVPGVIVKEWFPQDWILAETMLQSGYPVFQKSETDPDNSGYKIYSWVAIGTPVPSFSITYKLWMPDNASGDYQFYGRVLTTEDLVGNEIGGDSILYGNIGDIDGSGTVDISDVILCLRMAIGLNNPNIEKADINRDGVIDISDVILILRISIGLL